MDSKISLKIKIRLIGDTAFFGPGVAELLERIQQCGSIAAACKQMEMSYSKGRNMINNLENELGYKIVTRKQGGSMGGQSELTETGKLFLSTFRSFEADVTKYANEQFYKRFDSI